MISMHALVVYESMFGNTQSVAEAVAEGLGESVEVVEVGSSPVIGPYLDLLVVGGPTHAFGLTRETTRASAKQQAPNNQVVSEGNGVREWLDTLREPIRPTAAAAFDTRVAPVRVPGSAAKGIAKRLRHRGFDVVADPRTFWVTGTPGPLMEGELDRARAWGRELATCILVGAVLAGQVS